MQVIGGLEYVFPCFESGPTGKTQFSFLIRKYPSRALNQSYLQWVIFIEWASMIPKHGPIEWANVQVDKFLYFKS